MEPDVVMQVLTGLLEQGPLVGLLFYFYRETKLKTEELEEKISELSKKKDEEVSQLNMELRNKMEGYLSKTFETISSNTSALNGLKDVITVKSNG